MSNPALSALPAGLLLALTTAPAPARGDWLSQVYLNKNAFDVALSGMPDLDQRRSAAAGLLGLPGDGGMHCVPTSAINVLAYAAAHGFPFVAPGAANWQSDSNYQAATQAILNMGMLMGTQPGGMPNEGTNSGGAMNGYTSWLAPYPIFTVTGHFSKNNYAPLVENMAKAMANGALVAFCYGRYEHVGTFASLPLLDRDGGHCITLTRAYTYGNGQKEVWARDPAAPNDGKTITQSEFANNKYTISAHPVAVSPSIFGIRVMHALNFDPSKPKNAYLDGFISVRPKWGLSFTNTGSSIKVVHQIAAPFLSSNGQTESSLEWNGPALLDLVSAPGGDAVYLATAATGASANLVSLDLGDGSVTPLLSLPGAQKLMVGSDFSLYAGGGEKITRIDLSTEPPSAYTVIVPCFFEAMAFHDKAAEVVLFDKLNGNFLRYPYHLDSAPVVTKASDLPSGVEAQFSIDPTTGKYWLVEQDSARCFSVDPSNGAVEVFTLPGLNKPTSIDVDSLGHLFVVDQGRLIEYAQGPSGYSEFQGSLWTGRSTGKVFSISRDRSNADNTMVAPAWRNLLPEEVTSLVPTEAVVDCQNEPLVELYGTGKPAPNGQVPTIAASTVPFLGGRLGVTVSGATPGVLPFLVLGQQPLALPFDGGTLLAFPEWVLDFGAVVGASGAAELSAPLSANQTLCGLDFYAQVLYRETGAGGPLDTVQTRGLHLRIGS
jgi:hypothetical protein